MSAGLLVALIVVVVLLLVVVMLFFNQLPELRRYLKIRGM